MRSCVITEFTQGYGLEQPEDVVEPSAVVELLLNKKFEEKKFASTPTDCVFKEEEEDTLVIYEFY
ncbi:hypothetical protein FRX31_007409 [Thalictrum thalictroides]|uniref:Uncharacterized protein n=1 Tax=Thalictrum thalictroides TaxID=46969 RepID=A0A7J6X0X8_THATH|nr:hypothetical protein FRX31_007407 [Thalictrum thalictroides]KAF5203005.1 hypothetical protein FRX31_007409 [Thalictrum thalictroides]